MTATIRTCNLGYLVIVYRSGRFYDQATFKGFIAAQVWAESVMGGLK